MRGARIDALKQPPELVELLDVDGVRIEAVALNPVDVSVGSGAFYGGHPDLPYVPGCEAAGRMEDGTLVYLFGEGRGVSQAGFLAERVAKRHARVVHVGQSAGPVSPLRSADVRGEELTIVGHSNFALTKEEHDRAYLELLDHVTARRIDVPIERFPLDHAAGAWELQRSGPGGKVMIEL
jgi:NADPH:quinone reductase-like Zn-dependent oxidoreductase